MYLFIFISSLIYYLFVSLFIFIYLFLFTFLFIFICLFIFIYVSLFIYFYLFLCFFIYFYLCIYLFTKFYVFIFYLFTYLFVSLLFIYLIICKILKTARNFVLGTVTCDTHKIPFRSILQLSFCKTELPTHFQKSLTLNTSTATSERTSTLPTASLLNYFSADLLPGFMTRVR